MKSRRGFFGMLIAAPVIGALVAKTARRTEQPIPAWLTIRWTNADLLKQNLRELDAMLSKSADADYRRRLLGLRRDTVRQLRNSTPKGRTPDAR